MIPVVIVILYKFSNLALKFFGTVIVFQLNDVFHLSGSYSESELNIRIQKVLVLISNINDWKKDR